MVWEEINKLSAFEYGVVQKQYIVSLFPIAGAMETGSYFPHITPLTEVKHRILEMKRCSVLKMLE